MIDFGYDLEKRRSKKMNTAKIVAVTQPLIDNENGVRMTPDEFIAYCARVSNPSNQMNSLTAPKLLRYCAKHQHWSIFEMISITMSVETTRDIARQILRHRSFSFQEFSQRYADPTKDLGFVTREARLQDMKNRQNSIETDNKTLQQEWEDRQMTIRDTVEDIYSWAIENGIAKEQARAVLPEGLTVSRMYMNGTLRSWIHYCQLRMGVETQKEHREVARDAWYQIVEQFPSLKDCLDLGEK
jgi:thymidylate synthase (FAD)